MYEKCDLGHVNFECRFSVSGYTEPLVNDEEFVSKEELATARLYFKQPGHMVELQALKCVNNCFDTVTNSVLTSDYSILQALKKPWEETREKDKKREPITS
ncbi:hypothetical protein RIR_jg22803.t1 [Rhizophagus irregularis DAOM 181602=DAOM 197198]|nr:hypothetical protein RIR_jg22803.t1 [Rhizophagus irregularis DAOM 181602=DAOM 197198]